MTKTASQKARAKMARQNQQKKSNANTQRLVTNSNNQRGSSTSSVVKSRGATIFEQPSRRTNIRQTYYRDLGEVSFKGMRAKKIQARDFLTTINFLTTQLAGSMVSNIMVCPTIGPFIGTRLNREASMYEKYLFTKLIVGLDTGSGSSNNGDYIIAYDRDPSDLTPPSGNPGIREYYAMQGSQSFQIGFSGQVEFPLADTQDFYYTDPGSSGFSDERLYSQGQIYVAIGPQVMSANINCALFVEYEIYFFDPQLGTLTSEAKLTSTGFSPSNTPGQAWPVANVPIGNVIQIGDGIRPIIDPSGNYRGFNLDAGIYYLEQVLKNVGGANGASAPSLLALDPKEQGGIIDTVLENWAATVANGNAFRSEKIVVPSSGLNMFGTVTNGAISLDNILVRVVNMGLQDPV